MQRTIWKAVLKAADTQAIKVPAGAEMLCAREQHEEICVWFRCDPTAPQTEREIAIVGTGHPAPAGEGRYLGTASLRGGSLMFHVFERTLTCQRTPPMPTDDQVWKMLDAWYALIGRHAEPSADARQRDFDRMKRSIESFELSRKE